MIHPHVADKIKDSSEFGALREHILDERNKLLLNSDIDFTDKEKAAIQGQGRQEAVKILDAILLPFLGMAQEETNKGAETRARTGLE